MLQIAICDDNKEDLEKIHQAAIAYFGETNPNVKYYLYNTSFDLLDDIEKHNVFDILLLDICMPGMLGTDVAAELRKEKLTSEIVFLTTSDEFAIEAFAVNAAHYLLKPFTQEQFDEAMIRAQDRIRQRNSRRIPFRIRSGVRVVEIDNIIYVESNGHMLAVHLQDGDVVESRQTLTTLLDTLESLAPGQFVSPSKGYIVNQKSIRSVKSTYVDIADAQIPLPKGKYRQFQESYFDYIFSL